VNGNIETDRNREKKDTTKQRRGRGTGLLEGRRQAIEINEATQKKCS
jgi:hypothetical protein